MLKDLLPLFVLVAQEKILNFAPRYLEEKIECCSVEMLDWNNLAILDEYLEHWGLKDNDEFKNISSYIESLKNNWRGL